MINRQVRQFYIDKENVDHSITDRLISGGYVQPAGGYILNAKRSGVKEPSQYWHLIYSWSAQSEDEAPFNKSIQCGEDCTAGRGIYACSECGGHPGYG